MEDFQQQLAQFPIELRKAWSVGFVFVKEADHYWHFPARQWEDKQIQNYFLERFNQSSSFVSYPELGLKQLVIKNRPVLLIIIPYSPE